MDACQDGLSQYIALQYVALKRNYMEGMMNDLW